MSIVFLYQFHEYISLVKYDPTIDRINMPNVQYNTKIYKGVSNNIDFIIRNNDRRPIKLFNNTLQAQIQRADTVSLGPTSKLMISPEVLLKKYCTITDEQQGKARLTLHADDISTWDPGYYRYVIQMFDDEQNGEYLYTDVNKNTFGNFELYEGVVSSLQPAIEIYERQFTPTPVDLYDYTIWVSGAYPGDAQTGRANGMHSIAVYQENWTGKFWVEGSLTVDAPLPSQWFRIALTPTTEFYEFNRSNNWCGPIPLNLTVNAYWIRFIFRPDISNTGRFLRVLYKN